MQIRQMSEPEYTLINGIHQQLQGEFRIERDRLQATIDQAQVVLDRVKVIEGLSEVNRSQALKSANGDLVRAEIELSDAVAAYEPNLVAAGYAAGQRDGFKQALWIVDILNGMRDRKADSDAMDTLFEKLGNG